MNFLNVFECPTGRGKCHSIPGLLSSVWDIFNSNEKTFLQTNYNSIKYATVVAALTTMKSAKHPREPLADLRDNGNRSNIVAEKAGLSKKPRAFDLASARSQAEREQKHPWQPAEKNNEILMRSWLTLPHSQFGILYDLGSTRMYETEPPMSNENGMAVLQMAANRCPFELKMQELKNVISTKYPQKGAGLVYTREIFEPQDPEYGPPWILGPRVDVRVISQKQVNRLRIMICDENLREAMFSFANYFYSSLENYAACNVVDYFELWKKKYRQLKADRVKFNRIFCFTFCLQQFCGWMYRMERGLGRSKMVEGLAIRWKNLLKTTTPEELGLDMEFSYPAVEALLQSFKVKIEMAPTFGDPKMIFQYE